MFGGTGDIDVDEDCGLCGLWSWWWKSRTADAIVRALRGLAIRCDAPMTRIDLSTCDLAGIARYNRINISQSDNLSESW